MRTSELPVVHCLGAGRAARTLLHLLHSYEQVRIGSVVNRCLASARAAVAFIGAGEACTVLPSSACGEGLLIGVAESELAVVVAQIQAERRLQGLDFAFHLSASQSSSVLHGLAPRLASCHPALAFANPRQAVSQFAGTRCVLEGEVSLVAELEHRLRALGARVVSAPGLNKPQYHAAAIAASNFILAVLGLAERWAQRAGLPPSDARQLLVGLAIRNLQASSELGPASAFTGPMERGDVTALQGLLESLQSTGSTGCFDREGQKEDTQAWLRLLLLCEPLVVQKGALNAEKLSALRAFLNQLQ